MKTINTNQHLSESQMKSQTNIGQKATSTIKLKDLLILQEKHWGKSNSLRTEDLESSDEDEEEDDEMGEPHGGKV